MPFNLEDLGNNIKKIRKSRESNIKPGNHLSQYELAEISEISASSLCNIENGKYKNPTWNILSKIAKGLNCEIYEFFVYNKKDASPSLIALDELIDMMIKEKIDKILAEKIINNKNCRK